MTGESAGAGPGRYRLAVAALAGVSGAAVAAYASQSGFESDDFTNLNEAHRWGLGWKLLTTPVFGNRVAPGHRFFDWLVLQLPGHERTLAVGFEALGVAASTALIAVFVRRLTASRPAALLTAAIWGSSFVWLGTSRWWWASGHIIGQTAFSIPSLIFVLRWQASRRWTDLVGAFAFLCAAWLFSPRAVIVPLIAFVLLVVVAPPTRSIDWREAFRRLRSTWFVPAGMLVFSAAYTYFDIKSEPAGSFGYPSGSQWASLVWHWVVDGLGGLAVNAVPVPTHLPALDVIVGWLVLLAVAASTIRGSRSLLVWVSALSIVAVCGIQVGYQRLIQYGMAVIMAEPRYHEGDMLVMATLIPAAWLAAGKPVPGTARRRRILAGVIGAFFVLWIANGISSIDQLRATDKSPRAGRTLENIRRTLPAVTSEVPSATLTTYSEPVGLNSTGYLQLPLTLGTFVPQARIDVGRLGGTPIWINDDGIASRLILGPATSLLGDPPACLRSAPRSTMFSPGQAVASFPLPPAKSGRIRVVTVRTGPTAVRGVLAVIFRPSVDGYPVFYTRPEAANPGFTISAPATQGELQVLAWGGFSACFTEVSVAQARPAVP